MLLQNPHFIVVAPLDDELDGRLRPDPAEALAVLFFIDTIAWRIRLAEFLREPERKRLAKFQFLTL